MKQEIFNEWLDDILKSEKPSDDIIAYYFGILESTEGFMTYLIGSAEFTDDDDGWACNDDFTPRNKYLNLGNDPNDWEKVLEEVKSLVLNYIKLPQFKDSFLDKSIAIATGFDDGDLCKLK
jgi:hypothetical protein